jgi:homoaconitase/3-isopropylmalate dehydratase large subunit
MPSTESSSPKTLYDKVFQDHIVAEENGGTYLIYIDRHLVHEVTSPQAFEGLRTAKRPVRRVDCTLATVDHNIPTTSRKGFNGDLGGFIEEKESRTQCVTLESNVKAFGITYFGLKDKRQGIVHVIGPEQGFTLPVSIFPQSTVVVVADLLDRKGGEWQSLERSGNAAGSPVKEGRNFADNQGEYESL